MTVQLPEQLEEMAGKLVSELEKLLGASVTLSDEAGRVLASTRAGRPNEKPGLTNTTRLPVQLPGLKRAELLIEQADDREIVSPRLLQGLVELVLKQGPGSHNAAGETQLKSKFIHDILRGPVKAEAYYLREGQMLGFDLSHPRAVVLIDAANYILAPDSGGWLESREGWIRRRAHHIIELVVNYFHLPDETICAYIGEGEIAILKASTTQDLASWSEHGDDSDGFDPSWANLAALKRACGGLLVQLQTRFKVPVNLGIGRYHPGIAGLTRSYQDARAAISLGSRTQAHHGVYCLDGLGIATFVGISDERTKNELARHLLSPLDQEPELLEMLHLFFFNSCCPSTTAKQLSIHRNTLSYRLDKVASLTGLDPRRFDEAIQIRLALLLRSLKTKGGSSELL